ncbi:MAG: bifunctional UDP-N-acetylglucosamine diphosphorylase/glucosamine-1-phosphate N-acetyltransferase GlmU [Bacteriovoracaceae bacterium]|nr:bifunctional UDP-N-acetylglucosamine diphosphorylase/glucosamine-1-phosphate N-acetyltransferase GlmU [Bacteriovoracaceae bacterium]
MIQNIGVAILAAGEGKRLKIGKAKPLAPILGKRLIDFSLEAISNFGQSYAGQVECLVSVITGHKREEVENYITQNYDPQNRKISFAYQKEQLGTANALSAYFDSSEDTKKYDYTLVMCADTPLIQASEIQKLYEKLVDDNLDGVAATFQAENPTGYGRIVRNEGIGFHIVEEKDADFDTKKILEVNSGLYLLRTSFVLEHLGGISCENKASEFYLTDLFKSNHRVKPLMFSDAKKFMGVNTLSQLETCAHHLRREKITSLNEQGVYFIDSATNYIDWDVEIGEKTVVYPNVILEGDTVVGEDVLLGPGAIVKDSIIESDVEVKAYCHLEQVTLKKEAVVGPFARLRPGAVIGEKSKVGNFVEIKKAVLDKGAKVSHLSYIGDAHIGEDSNIGCGFITCNYDGANKHKTTIGKKTFIGSDTQMVAPITIGDECFVGSGSTITQSMPDGSFAIARSKQVTKEGMAKRFLKNKKK